MGNFLWKPELPGSVFLDANTPSHNSQAAEEQGDRLAKAKPKAKAKACSPGFWGFHTGSTKDALVPEYLGLCGGLAGRSRFSVAPPAPHC